MSLISEESINEVREKANLVDIISNYITLKKTGRTHKGLCPFHREKTPSFIVDAQKQLYHCFGCAEGGNVFNFVMKIENLSFAEAVEFLANKAGISLKYASKGKNKRLSSQKERFLQLNKQAAGFYHYLLMESEQGKVARDYLKVRSYGQTTAKTFKLGYASPNKRSLISYLMKKGFTQQEIATLDLVYTYGSQVRDRFFNRLMFPIEDARGNVVGFGGRALSERDQPKYLNSSTTPVFHKSQQFYGLNLAKNEIVKKDQVVIVEGYTDVISLHQHGIKNAVATLGTALTEQHVEILARFCSSAVMLFDSDTAGMKAAARGAEFVNLTNMEILVAVLPEGDPADYVLSQGADELTKIIDKAIPIIDFCLGQIVRQANELTSQRRLSVISKALDLIKRQQNAILEQDYLQKLAKLTSISIESLTVEYNKKRGITKEENTNKATISAEEKAENLFLALLIEEPSLAQKCSDFISAEDFINEKHSSLYKILLSNQSQIANILHKIEDDELKKHLSALSFLQKPSNLEAAFLDVSKKLKDLALKRQINKVKDVLEKTNPVDKRAEYDKLFKQLIELEAHRRDLAKTKIDIFAANV